MKENFEIINTNFSLIQTNLEMCINSYVYKNYLNEETELIKTTNQELDRLHIEINRMHIQINEHIEK